MWILTGLAVLLLAAVVLSMGCAGLYAPKTAHETVPGPAALVQQRAVRAFAQMGGTITQHNLQEGVIIGTVHNAVQLYVQVIPLDDQHARVEVLGSVLKDKLVIGEFSEVADFLALLKEGR